MIGDRHDGAEWVGMDALVTSWLRRAGWRLQSKGLWAQMRSRERWDNRVNYLLRFRKAGIRSCGHADHALLDAAAAALAPGQPLGRDPGARCVRGDARALRKRRGAVLDPFAGAGTVGRVAAALGREWIGVERDPQMAALTARRLRLRPVRP